MGLATATSAKVVCNLLNIPDTVWAPHLPEAESITRGFVGDTIYDAVSVPSLPYTAADKTALTRAEEFILGSTVARLSAVATAGQGLVDGFGGGREGAQPILSFPSAMRVADELLRKGLAALEPFRRLYRAELESAGLSDSRRVRVGPLRMNASGPNLG